jgi:hypothetical protein
VDLDPIAEAAPLGAFALDIPSILFACTDPIRPSSVMGFGRLGSEESSLCNGEVRIGDADFLLCASAAVWVPREEFRGETLPV